MSDAVRGLVAEPDLFSWFHARVETAVAHRRAPVSESAVYYLSSLLTETAKRDETSDTSTLVELRQKAANAPFGEAVTLWRSLGDQSLLSVGFFREHLRRRNLSPAYYAEMGRSAYALLGRLLRDPSGSATDVFGELAEKYEACTEVIAEVRDEAAERSTTDVVRLYEEYLDTGSPRVADRLRQLGVVPIRARGQG